jgi:polyferredoxin
MILAGQAIGWPASSHRAASVGGKTMPFLQKPPWGFSWAVWGCGLGLLGRSGQGEKRERKGRSGLRPREREERGFLPFFLIFLFLVLFLLSKSIFKSVFLNEV